MNTNLSVELARFIRQTSYDRLPADVVQFAKLCILDWLSSALAGEKKPPVQMIRNLVEELGGQEQATLITGGRSSVANAALLNGAASHVVELDDIHKASIIHAATVVIPAALAVGEWKQSSGQDLITAVVIGYDVCFRIGEAVSPSHYYYWHNTATCGTFGSAAAVAKLLNLSEQQIVHALGNAGTQAAGLWEFIEDGTMSKQLHTGKAAMNGLLAALLAEKGFTGASRILEGKRGFFEAMSEQYDSSLITKDLGETFKIVENSFKIHASCRHTHHAIDIVLDLINELHLNSEIVDSVRVKTYQVALNITDNRDPQTIYAAKFSLQYCVALAFVKAGAGLSDFNDDTLWDPKIREFMQKIEVLVDDEIDASYPIQWGAQLEVQLRDGQQIIRKKDYPKGDPESPVNDELIDKFRSLTKDRNSDLVEGLISRLMNLEQLDDVNSIFTPAWGGK